MSELEDICKEILTSNLLIYEDVNSNDTALAAPHPVISGVTNLATPNFSTESPLSEISGTSNLEILTSLAAQLANPSTDGSSQGLQFEEVDLARYTSEPAYIQPEFKSEKDFYSLLPVSFNEDIDMMDGGENVDLERYSRGDVKMEEIEMYRHEIKQDNIALEECSSEDSGKEKLDSARRSLLLENIIARKNTIQDGKIRKKRGSPKYHKLWDQPAKLPPLPQESELFDDLELEIGSRKEKSLTLLAKKMLEMFPMQGLDLSQVIQLDQTANFLGTDVRRLAVIVDVFEALHIMSKVDKNLYSWHGCVFLIPTLAWLKQIAVEMGVHEQYEFVRNRELEIILKNAEKAAIWEIELPEETQGTSSDPSSNSPQEPAVSPQYNPKYCGTTSVGINTQLFLMLMLVAPEPKTVTLQFAASVMHGATKFKKTNLVRRFLDVSNVLSCLGLILKVRTATAQGSRNAFQYAGPDLVDLDVSELDKMALPVSRRKNSVLPYPQSSENNGEIGDMKKRGNKEVIVQDVIGMKRRGRKPGQKNAKKVKTTTDIVSEIVETIVNEILEIPDKIVKKKPGKKLGRKKGCKNITNIAAKDKKTDLLNVIDDMQHVGGNGNRNTSDNVKYSEGNKKTWWKKVRMHDYLRKERNSCMTTGDNVNERIAGGDKDKALEQKKNKKVIIDEKKMIGVKSRKRKLSKNKKVDQIEAGEGGVESKSSSTGDKKIKLKKDIDAITNREEHGSRRSGRVLGRKKGKDEIIDTERHGYALLMRTIKLTDIKSNDKKRCLTGRKSNSKKKIFLIEAESNKKKIDPTDIESNGNKKTALKIKIDTTNANCFDLGSPEDAKSCSKIKLPYLSFSCEVEKD